MRILRGKRFYVLVVIIAMVLFATQACKKGEEKLPEGTVAVVNGQIVTQEDFDTQLSLVQQRFPNIDQTNDEQLAEVKKEVLEGLINQKVLYQESEKKGIEVSEAAIDERLVAMRKRFPDEEGFKGMLDKMRLTEDSLRVQLRQGLAIQELITREVLSSIEISDKETKDYYDGNADLFKQPEKIQASHILIKIETGASEAEKAEALKKIKRIQKELKAGGDFAELAKKHSQCPSSSKGGDLGYFARGQMVKPFEDAAFSLKPGEVSDIVETSFGYHLIKAGERQPEGRTEYKDVKDKLLQYLKRVKTEEEGKEYIEKLKKSAKVERFLTETKKQEPAE